MKMNKFKYLTIKKIIINNEINNINNSKMMKPKSPPPIHTHINPNTGSTMPTPINNNN